MPLHTSLPPTSSCMKSSTFCYFREVVSQVTIILGYIPPSHTPPPTPTTCLISLHLCLSICLDLTSDFFVQDVSILVLFHILHKELYNIYFVAHKVHFYRN